MIIQLTIPSRIEAVRTVEQGVSPSPGPESSETPAPSTPAASPEETAVIVDGLQAQLAQTCEVLNNVAGKLKAFQEQALASHSEDIARLAVEIARKILAQKVQERDYEIVSIVQEALNTAPAHAEMTVYVHPDDLAPCQELQQGQPDSALAQIRFLADPALAPAECRVETPTGSVRSCISEQLEQISNALMKAH